MVGEASPQSPLDALLEGHYHAVVSKGRTGDPAAVARDLKALLIRDQKSMDAATAQLARLQALKDQCDPYGGFALRDFIGSIAYEVLSTVLKEVGQ